VNKAEYADYLKTEHWAQLKLALYAKRGRTCMACSSKKRIQAHHVNYRHPITDCTSDDLMPLCRECHEAVHETKLDAECAQLPDNNARRLHVILGLMPRLNTKPISPGVLPDKLKVQRITRKPRENRASRRQRKIAANLRLSVRYAIAPNSPADLHQKRMAELRLKRQAEDRGGVNLALKNSTEPKMSLEDERRERRIAALNRNGLNVKPTVFY
jgi:hypothetical protein